MGCGQSKIHLYPRKNKSKANGKKSGHRDADADADEDEGHAEDRDINNEKEKIDENSTLGNSGTIEHMNGDVTLSILRKNGPLLQSQEISSSQQNFFRMLDKKIEDGPDYDSSSETEMALEEARLNALVQHWESASLTASICSSTSRSLQGTPVRHNPMRPTSQQQQQQQQQLRQQFQQPLLNADILAQQQIIKQQQLLHLQQQQQHLQQHQQALSVNSPKRLIGDGIIGSRQIITQSIVHQNYGVAPQQQQQGPAQSQQSPSNQQQSLLLQQQQQQQQPQQQQSQLRQNQRGLPVAVAQPVVCLQMPYYAQPPQQTYFGDMLHQIQVPQQQQQQIVEPRFPPAISVQRLAPQVQRQLRETQELIRDSCPQLYAAGYGSPGPPLRTIVQQQLLQQQHQQQQQQTATTPQQKNTRRPTLETQYSTELS